MHRFTAQGPFTVGSDVPLDPVQSHHVAKVLRLEAGERIALIDGQGSLAFAVLEEVRPKAARAKVDSVEQSTERSRLSLCFAIPKGQALDFVFRRAPELGLESMVPLQTRFSSSAKGWNADRWAGVVSEVCKQCEELHFPHVAEPQTLAAWLESRDTSRTLVICDENARDEKVDALPATGIDLVVGAEGGLSREEVESLKKAGARLLGLGRNRLRAETAALVALTLLKKQAGEM
jgi:16S rRNA (uracil1498-N3)-methyltransferase